VMNSYSSVDGLPCGASRAILTDLLRGELGFDGVVVADYFTLDFLESQHRVADNPVDAAQRAIEAGLDVELPMLSSFAHLGNLVDEGKLDIVVLDRAVHRALSVKFRLGLFESPYVDEDAAGAVFDTPEQRTLARQIAQQSVVVVTNRGALPIATGVHTMAVIGPTADDQRLLQGDYHYPAHLEILGQGGHLPEAGAAFAPGAYYTPHITPLAGIHARAGDAKRVLHAPGCAINGDDTSGIGAAVDVAQRADIALVFVGGRSGLVEECTVGEARDAASLGLTGRQSELIDAVIATGTPTVVVLISGRVHALPEVAERADAMVYAWCPGEEGGNAIADVLFGDVDATGRLPVSIPRSVGHIPAHYNHRAGGGGSQFYGDYADSPVAPLFPFGSGLSYTTFDYRDLCVASDKPTTDSSFSLEVIVENTGLRAGTEIVQLYLRDEVASVARPDRQLAGFARVELPAGEARTLHFEVDPTQLAFHDETMGLVIEPGTLRAFIGGLECAFELDGSRRTISRRDIVATRVTIER
jgi:beta-glucosidase